MSSHVAEVPTLADAIARILARLPRPLADDSARSRLMKVAAQLPAEFLGGPIGLELRLAGPTEVDLFAAALPGDATFTALIDALGRPGWADTDRAVALGRTLAAWQRGSGQLPLVARYLLVEADAPPAAEAPVSVPSIFLAPRGAHDHWRAGMPPNAFQSRPETTTRAAAELSGVWPDPATAESLRKVADTLPETADIFAVGAMISRASGASMRVAVRRLSPDQTRELLRAVDRPRQADLIADYCARTCATRQVVAFEVGPGAEQRVGLELSPQLDWKQASAEGWRELLEEMVGGGFATPERAECVPGLIDPHGNPLWGLAHVKIAADGTGMMPGSKLYVGLQHRSAG